MKKGQLLILMLLPLALASCNNQTSNSTTGSTSTTTSTSKPNSTTGSASTSSSTSQEILPTDIDVQVKGEYVLNGDVYDVLVGTEISFTCKVIPENATNKEVIYTLSGNDKDKVSVSKDKIKFLKTADEIKITNSVEGKSVKK